jgi:hypothetical protein
VFEFEIQTIQQLQYKPNHFRISFKHPNYRGVTMVPQRDPSAASPFPHTKRGAHALTRKTYVANQNNFFSKPAQEDIANGFVSSTLGPSRDNLASLPMFHCLIPPTNSTLS